MISTNPPKGTYDWFPEEFQVRKYIFDTWRKVCLSYGFEEYLGPLVEDIAIWEAKSGEDVGGSELTRLTDKSGEISNLALRPEMTPTVTRMVSKVWKEIEKPVKWFSIANFYRNERPQKGRNREFWQLNCDIFGQNGIESDIEILSLGLELMLAFNPPKDSFKLHLNHRKVLDSFFSKISENIDKVALFRLLDKYKKLSKETFEASLKDLGVSQENISLTLKFLNSKSIEELDENFSFLSKNPDYKYFKKIFENLEKLGYGEYLQFSGALIRGFDYYDGVIFEVFDNNPENPRALFGGGRYNGLAGIFGVKEDIPAVGMAPGDETLKIFLENWGILKNLPKTKNTIYFPLLSEELFLESQKLATKLRKSGKNILFSLNTKKIVKALKFAEKNNFENILIFGENEAKDKKYILKNLKSGEERIFEI
ncbi:histidine--tRNA ligase [Candidatus Gracilibacteria bacterium GN02-872]|nr:histidine--tRNA ligase [Candidatus Gracilibacteria bacterium GN02-872]